MNKINNFNDLINGDVKTIIEYVCSADKFRFEEEILSSLNQFEEKFNKYLVQDKRDYYLNKPLNVNSKFKFEIKDWMLDRLITLDLIDSIDKFFYLQIMDLYNN